MLLKELKKKQVGLEYNIHRFIFKIKLGFTNVMTVKIGSPVTMDYRMDRVRVFVDGKGIVKNPPSVG
jgi:hypothetical protein